MIATFQHDLPSLIVGIALCTIAIGLFAFGLLGRRIANVDLPIAGAFAMNYGFRLIIKTESIRLLLGDPGWLPYLRSSMEYIVPLTGAVLFERFFGDRLRWLNRLVWIAFLICAAVAIPYEILARQPFAFQNIINGIILGFLCVYLLNIAMPAPGETQDWQILRVATAIFGVSIINEHFHFVTDRLGLTSEPVGFLIFIGTIVFTLIRHTVRAQMRVASVDGELAAARQIQMSIIPKTPPAIRGLDLAAIYAPASEVAGDFYDFLAIDEQRVGILVADVSGHGVPAALVASMLKVALAGHADRGTQPARLLQEFNEFFCGKLERQFITATYALIDAAAGSVTVASAGHPPPLVVRGNRSVEELTADGPLLGHFRTARFAERSASLRDGDALVLYTDGIPEALNSAREMWGESRFREAAAASASESAGATAKRILSGVESWSTPLHDDVTLVVAKRV